MYKDKPEGEIFLNCMSCAVYGDAQLRKRAAGFQEFLFFAVNIFEENVHSILII